MPKTNCCMPHCHATSKRYKHSSWHVFPRDETLRKRWIVLIRNDNLRVNLKGTSLCGLHFRGSRRTYEEKTPTIFPWMPEWSGKCLQQEGDRWIFITYERSPVQLRLTVDVGHSGALGMLPVCTATAKAHHQELVAVWHVIPVWVSQFECKFRYG